MVREQKPLPEEPRVDRTDEIGTYGGRSYSAIVDWSQDVQCLDGERNETSTDITGLL
ncbi:MAG: hypothetical protein U0Q11_22790 [Vicinamibacterales bacterium]